MFDSDFFEISERESDDLGHSVDEDERRSGKNEPGTNKD
jgi:hypothetical protein